MSKHYERASAKASSLAKELDFQIFVYQNEDQYPIWCTRSRILNWLQSLPDDIYWHTEIGACTLICIMLLSIDYLKADSFQLLNLLYNILYAVYVVGLFGNDIFTFKAERSNFHWTHWISYVLDLATYSVFLIPYVTDERSAYIFQIFFYNLRLHRTYTFLMALNDYNFRGSVVGTLVKYMYIFAIIRVISTNVFIWLGEIQDMAFDDPPEWLKKVLGRMFFKGFYVVHKLFILIGPDSHPKDDMSRLLYMIVMILGCLLLMGITVASLALIIALYMRPEEIFRLRFRLIMNDMRESYVPTALRTRVETFYRMYWHKQKAVSVTQLLPTFPPTLPAVIYTNIYFKAQQKSRILRDLSYQFLSELAKYMETIHYIPGDPVIKRNSPKSHIIYISYGDVEMLSAEDDDTAILRFTRGTIINPCGGCTEVACTRSHVAIRAATFCTAHVLKAADLWRVVNKHGKLNGQGFIIHSSFEYHLERVKNHYEHQVHSQHKYKSNIVMLKRNLIDLKEARDTDGKLLLKRADIFLEIAACYLMRNHADSSLIEDSDEICLRNTYPCILQPKSSLKLTWSIFVAAITLAVAYAHPYHLVYLKSVSTKFRFFDGVVTLIYIMDIIVHLSTGAKIEEGVPITFGQTSSLQMKSCWFVLDVISTVPIFEFVGQGYFSGMNKLCKLPKMFRVLKHMEDLSVFHSHALRFMSYFLLINLLCYLVAALQQGYWCIEFGYCIVKNITEPPYWVQQPLDDGPVGSRLSFSMYWSISMITFTSHKTAMVNKGLWRNQIFVMVILEVCTVIHIMVEASYSATIMVTETMRDQYNTCIDTVKNFLVKNNVDPLLRHRFINYLQLCWYTDKAYSISNKKTSILFDLPPHVYQEILAMQRSKYILCVPFMKFLNNAMLKNVSSLARLFYTSPNEILLNTGDISNELYVIKQGFCEVVDPVTKRVVHLISSKDHFGVVECLLRIPAYYTVRAVTHVQVFSISRKNLIEVEVIETPKIKDAINFAKQQPEYLVLQERREQFLWYQIPLPPPNRQKFPLPRKYEPDTDFMDPFRRLGFCSILRYVFPRYTIRPDGTYLKRYEWFRAACAFIAATLYPLYSFLELQWPWLWHLAMFLDFVAYFDICQRMLIGYFNEKGILVYHPASTAAHYMRGAFIVDVLACVPLEMFDRKTNYFANDAYRHPDSFQYFMYNRVLQLYRLPHALEILNEYFDRRDIILIIKAFPLFISLLVLVTSLIMGYSVEKWSIVGGGWILKIKSDPMYGSWIAANVDHVRFNIIESPWNLMLTTCYWVIYETTTTGFNLFQPSRLNILEVLIFSMLLGAILNTYFAVRVISIRANVNQALADFQEHMKDIIVFMVKENLNKELQQEVMSYYEYNWDKMGGTNYRNVLKLCDQITLRTDAILHIYGPIFTACPILHHCDLALLRIIGRAVYSLYFKANMVIIERDDVITEMYFVDYGIIEVRDPNYDNLVITNLSRGSAFGNLDNVKTAICPNKFVAKSNVHLLKINAERFYGIINEFPDVKTFLKKFRPRNENYIIGGLDNQSQTMASKNGPNPTASKWFLKCFALHIKAIQSFLIIVSMLCVYGDLYNAGFQNNDYKLITILYILDATFMLKIIIMIFQPVAKDENLSKAFMGRKRYIATEFKYDILSCIPFEIFSIFMDNHRSFFAFLRLNRLFRVVTVYNCLKRIQRNLSINLTIYTINSVFIWFTLFVHTATCIWNVLGVYEDYVEPNTSWRFHDNKTVLCDNYLCAMYFVLTTFTQNGVGDILPRKQSEVAFVCILMILSTMIYMIYVGEFSNIIQFRYFRFFSYYSKYIELKEFLKNNHVSENLAKIVQKYTLHLWQESRGLQIPEFLCSAPGCLRLNIMSAAYMDHLRTHPVFKDCEPAFLRQLVGCLHPFFYEKNMYVVKEGDITNSMYFIHKGRVNEIDEDFEVISAEFTAKEHFGWANGLDRDVAYQYSYKTAVKSQILTLCLEDWEYLLRHFPHSHNSIFKYKDDQQDLDSKPQVKPAQRLSFKLPPSKLIRSSNRKKSPGPASRDTYTLQNMMSSSEVSVAHSVKKTFSGIRIQKSVSDIDSVTTERATSKTTKLSEAIPLPTDQETSKSEIKDQVNLPFLIEDITGEELKPNQIDNKSEIEGQNEGFSSNEKVYLWPLDSRHSEELPLVSDKNDSQTLIHPGDKKYDSLAQLPTLKTSLNEKYTLEEIIEIPEQEISLVAEMKKLVNNKKINEADDNRQLVVFPIASKTTQEGGSGEMLHTSQINYFKMGSDETLTATKIESDKTSKISLQTIKIEAVKSDAKIFAERVQVSKKNSNVQFGPSSSKQTHVHYKDSKRLVTGNSVGNVEDSRKYNMAKLNSSSLSAITQSHGQLTIREQHDSDDQHTTAVSETTIVPQIETPSAEEGLEKDETRNDNKK